jgi:hypothetical protein
VAEICRFRRSADELRVIHRLSGSWSSARHRELQELVDFQIFDVAALLAMLAENPLVTEKWWPWDFLVFR